MSFLWFFLNLHAVDGIISSPDFMDVTISILIIFTINDFSTSVFFISHDMVSERVFGAFYVVFRIPGRVHWCVWTLNSDNNNTSSDIERVSFVFHRFYDVYRITTDNVTVTSNVLKGRWFHIRLLLIFNDPPGRDESHFPTAMAAGLFQNSSLHFGSHLFHSIPTNKKREFSTQRPVC